MAYQSTAQVIERANGTRQFYLICPAPLARAMEIETQHHRGGEGDQGGQRSAPTGAGDGGSNGQA
jgi:hypothetical protein